MITAMRVGSSLILLALGCGAADPDRPPAGPSSSGEVASDSGVTSGAPEPTGASSSSASLDGSGGSDPTTGGEIDGTSTGGPLPPLDPDFPAWVDETSDDPLSNRCATSPAADIMGLPVDPVPVMAYRSGLSPCSVAAPNAEQGTMIHRQGLGRLHVGPLNYMVVSVSVPAGIAPGIEVVELGSRPDTHGPLGAGGVVPGGPANCEDAIIAYAEDGGGGLHDHGGGLQVLGHWAVVPFEAIDDGAAAGFRSADLRVPDAPSFGPLIARTQGSTTNAGAAGLVRLSDGRFMVLVFGNDSDEGEVFVTEAADPGPTAAWSARAAFTTPSPEFRAYQNVQLVAGCDGALFAAGTHKDGNDDWIDLWRVRLSNAEDLAPSFEEVAQRNLRCSSGNTGGVRYCDFDAAATPWVTDAGRLLVYGIEHYDDDVGGGRVRMREFVAQ